MRALLVAALLLVVMFLVPKVVRAQRHWEHDRGEHEHWEHEREHEEHEHEHWRPRAYPVLPYVEVPAPLPVCPVQCWPVSVCNPYGWCHWERHCEPRC
jgi:hypothetical protein